MTIDDTRHVVMGYEKMLGTNFMAARWRKDMRWGFECKCGNDNRLALAEKGDMDKLVMGTPLSIAKIAKSLTIPDSEQFTMGRI